MLSKITIDFTEDFKPVIKIKKSKLSDDVRDKLLSSFLQELGYRSNILHIEQEHDDDDCTIYHVKPIEDQFNHAVSLVEVDAMHKSFLSFEKNDGTIHTLDGRDRDDLQNKIRSAILFLKNPFKDLQ